MSTSPLKADEELKPCPFCGGHAEIFTTDGTEVGTYFYWAECWVCESRTGLRETEKKTTEAWNQRAAIVVELPDYRGAETYQSAGFNEAIDECDNILRAAGITVKGDS